MSTIPSIPDPTPEIEGAFVAFVQAAPTFAAMQVLRASDRSTEVKPPYVFCRALAIEPRAHGYYVAQMQVVIVTNIDDASNELRSELSGKLFSLFRPVDGAGKSRAFTTEAGDVRVCGWDWPTPREASDGQEAGTAIGFTAGVQVRG